MQPGPLGGREGCRPCGAEPGPGSATIIREAARGKRHQRGCCTDSQAAVGSGARSPAPVMASSESGRSTSSMASDRAHTTGRSPTRPTRRARGDSSTWPSPARSDVPELLRALRFGRRRTGSGCRSPQQRQRWPGPGMPRRCAVVPAHQASSRHLELTGLRWSRDRPGEPIGGRPNAAESCPSRVDAAASGRTHANADL